eukprot:5088340-Lingulodinium_polyedra.AAC.1
MPRHAPTWDSTHSAHEMDDARPRARIVASFLGPDEGGLRLDIPAHEVQGVCQGAAPMAPA